MSGLIDQCPIIERYSDSDTVRITNREHDRLIMEAKISEKHKNEAYRERNMLVCTLSKLFPSWLEKHPIADEDWDDGWRNIVFIDSSKGQLSWYIHDSERWLFSHLEMKEGNSWDGHTTDEKYKRLLALDWVRL